MEEILNDILTELRYLNSHNRELEERLSALEKKDRFLTKGEAREYLGVSYHTLQNRTEKGLIKAVCRGGKVGYMMSDLRAIK